MNTIAVVGANGKMGRPICEELRKRGFEVKEVDISSQHSKLEDIDCPIDMVIDFSTKTQSIPVLHFCVKSSTRLIMGTTGQDENFATKLNLAATKIPIIKCDNFSKNVQKFINLAQIMSKNFNGDISIVETHHKNKLDSPSGTAKSIASVIRKNHEQMNIFSVRGGTMFGRHEIHFFDEDEEIILTHSSNSRKPFINGLMLAVDFLLEQNEPKLYEFDDFA